MKTELFEFQVRVHPTREHPCFNEIEFGKLIIFIYGTNREDALIKASKIACLLPYRIGAAKIFPVAEQEKLDSYQVACIEKAKTIGVRCALFHWPKGTDEKTVLHSWPYLVPPMDEH